MRNYIQTLAALTIITTSASLLTACSAIEPDINPCVVQVNGEEPEVRVTPGMTRDAAGFRILKMISSGLVHLDSDNNVVMDLAKSIEKTSPTTYLVELQPGLKFSDGSRITARSFVDSWNFIVATDELNTEFFQPIAGFSEKTPSMRGLTVTSDTTFKIELSKPTPDFLVQLSHPVFSAQPESALKEDQVFNLMPTSSGPYVVETWVRNQALKLRVNPEYKGPRKAVNDGVTMNFFIGRKLPFEELQRGSLDVFDNVNGSDIEKARKDFGFYAKPGAAVLELSIHSETPHFQGIEGKLRRQAISLSIDREKIAKDTLKGTFEPAYSFVPPGIPGVDASIGVEGYDPERARELWAQADLINPFDFEVPVHYNWDSGDNRAWGPEVARQLKNNLGINAFPEPGSDHARFRYDYHDVRFNGVYRTGWRADFPSIRNYLENNYASDGVSNDAKYSNAEVDDLLKQADAAQSEDEAMALYNKAHELIVADLPAIPFLFPVVNAAWTTRVSDVGFGFDTLPEYHRITIDDNQCNKS
ncbi:ABC-type oligopeptide transport system, periplasmic component [Corynebacterium mustelae]|uniref:ABC-type oligopeptide transport system, periplasmic component n=1 Tax=Corynebacterium mustelae TaxID=571915 RepID=A0A0G3GWW5_9CORY|nr:ABC transporter substrate-binding protein [Corynebacterium mustelae]AKK05626.1 ABC-type oligopeptide transport system, periplasmic component [Corynebacterium mustelae]